MKLFFVVVSVLLFSGCALTSGGGEESRYYLLTNRLPEEAKSILSPGPALAIEPVSLPSYLEYSTLVSRRADSRYSESEMRVSEFHHWSGKLANNIGEVIRENLARLLEGREIFTLPSARIRDYGLRLELELIRFEPDDRGFVFFSARWRLFQGKVLIVSRLSEHQSGPVPEPRVSALVAEMSLLLGQLSQEIADEVIHIGRKSKLR